MTRSILLTATLVVLASAARADDGTACWLRNLERIDHVTNPPGGGDNSFFTRAGGPPNAYFLLVNDDKGLPGFELASVPAEERGCNASTFLNARRFEEQPYTPTRTYPDVDPGQSGKPPANSDKGFPNYFDANKAYRYLNWTTTSATGESTNAACDAVYPSHDPNRDACRQCLGSKGYYLHPTSNVPRDQVFSGNFLRFFPPTHLMLRRVFKLAVVEIQRVRMGITHFAEVDPGADPHGAVLQDELNPPCNLLGDTSASWNSNRGSIIGKWDGSGSTPGFGDGNKVVKAPLAEALLGLGAKYGDQGMLNAIWIPPGFAPGNNLSSAKDNHDSICVSCQFSAVIVIGNGKTPDLAIDDRIPDEIKSLGVLPAGARYRLGNACTAPTAAEDCGPDLRCSGDVGTCVDASYFDDVAKWLADKDLRQRYCGHASHGGGLCEPEQQHVATYTISIGRHSPLYESAARVGNGRYFEADDGVALANALVAVIQDIQRRATSFSIAAITTMQTRGTSYAFIPRFRPSVQARWEGHLYRFKLFNEFAAGCTFADTQAPMNDDKRSRNPNGDADCEDVYLQDAQGRFVGENEDGQFMLLDTNTWQVTETRADPVWDAADELTRRNLSADPRQIHTVIDRNGDRVFSPDEQIPFHESHASELLPWLALGGVSGPVCAPMGERLSKLYADETECAVDVIRFIRGHDVFDEDEDLDYDEARPKVLGDIFHSSPILVTPPAPRFLCDLGVVNQCVHSLYSPGLTPGGEQAYEEWRTALAARDQFVLVGANDGMVHAFHAGTSHTGDDPDTPAVEGEETRWFDLGTGRELWAFIPPDLLPKLKRLVTEERHELYVDESAMVRDVWVDGTNPGHKDVDEFRTLAVFGEREGGRHWFALDVTDPTAPQWRWGWPLPGSAEALEAGESWASLVPSAPPIVPIAVADDSGPLVVNGTPARERYVVLLNGGYDRNHLRGRSLSVIDAWTGEPLWRFARSDAASTSDPRWHLAPMPSAVAALDLGPGPGFSGVQDGLFDTAVVGDLAGQVWTFRFHAPGRDDDGDGLFDNWHGGRAFVEHRDAPLWKRSPFFHVPSATVLTENGSVRAYLGSGDRHNIRDTGGGRCGLGNLTACRRKNCTVEVDTPTYRNGPARALGRWRQAAGGTALARNAFTSTASSTALQCSDTLDVDFDLSIDCGEPTTFDFGLSCDWGATEAGVECTSERPWPPQSFVERSYATENARFYALQLFGDGDRAAYTTTEEARRYDAAALTETQLVDAEARRASASDPGYYIRYTHQDEATASGSGLLAGCVLWNTLIPDPANGACGAQQGDAARLYRAHFVTGASDCGRWDTVNPPPRYVARRSIVPPPAPTPVVSINPGTGEVRFSIITMDPGRPPAQVSLGGAEAAGLVHWIEVPRNVHRCRHEVAACE